jgi:glycyl-tRNA synthetase
MKTLFDVNGLMFFDQSEIRIRDGMIENFSTTVEQILLRENLAWRFFRTETPLLMPEALLNPNYTDDDVFAQSKYEFSDEELQVKRDDLVLRPETTAGSYTYAMHLLEPGIIKPPLCVWQVGKSFRREQDQPSSKMRLKEFYQMEFQCIYTTDTLNDYLEAVLKPIAHMIHAYTGMATRVVESDRLPSYSERTMDVEAILVDNFDEFVTMEMCSISRRTDFPSKLLFQTKHGIMEKDALVLEIAIGLDRCVYARQQYLKDIGDA